MRNWYQNHFNNRSQFKLDRIIYSFQKWLYFALKHDDDVTFYIIQWNTQNQFQTVLIIPFTKTHCKTSSYCDKLSYHLSFQQIDDLFGRQRVSFPCVCRFSYVILLAHYGHFISAGLGRRSTQCVIIKMRDRKSSRILKKQR